MTVGERIKAARLKAGLTQKQLGDWLGVTQSAVNNWEQSANVTVNTAAKVCNALGISLDELAEIKQPSDPEFSLARWNFTCAALREMLRYKDSEG